MAMRSPLASGSRLRIIASGVYPGHPAAPLVSAAFDVPPRSSPTTASSSSRPLARLSPAVRAFSSTAPAYRAPPHRSAPNSFVADRSLPPHLSQGASELDVLLPPPEALKPLRTEGFDRNQLKKSRKPTSPNGSNNAVPTAESLAALHQTHKPVKNELIPRRLVVCPIIPPSTKPEPALTIAELVDRPDVGPLLAAKTHDLILVRVGQVLVTPAGMNAADLSISEVSIVRLVDRAAAEAAAAAAAAEALAEAGGPEGVKTKTTRAQAALGKTSNLRNDGIAQDFPVSWVSSTNDVSHKLAQAREYLTTAHRVRLVFQPKRKGGRRDPVPPPDVQAEMLQSAATELADIADRSADDKYDKVKKAAYLCVFRLPSFSSFHALERGLLFFAPDNKRRA
jgi:hypothetical protein